jgi:hypothetical protein
MSLTDKSHPHSNLLMQYPQHGAWHHQSHLSLSFLYQKSCELKIIQLQKSSSKPVGQCLIFLFIVSCLLLCNRAFQYFFGGACVRRPENASCVVRLFFTFSLHLRRIICARAAASNHRLSDSRKSAQRERSLAAPRGNELVFY